MNRRRRRKTRTHSGAGLMRSWTMQRAAGVGVASGIAAILLTAVMDRWPGELLYPYVLLLASTAWCGASILWITAAGMRSRGTSGRMRPIRGFDVALGLVRLLPSLYALTLAWPDLEL